MQSDEIKRLDCLLEIYIDVNVDKDFSILSKKTDPFFILSMSGQFKYSNEKCANLLGFCRGELVQKRLNDLFGKPELNESESFFLNKDYEKLTNFDSRVTNKQGDVLDVNVTAFPILFDEGVIGSYVVLKDITSIKRERQLLSEKQAVAGQLAAGIAHEIRNPITAIKGFLQLMMNDSKAEDMYYKIVKSEIARIELILKELMVLAKPNKFKHDRIDAQLLLVQVITLMESQALLNNIEMIKNFNLTNVFVSGDENQLKQVFINFIKNGFEAMPDGGKLFIKGSLLSEGSIGIEFIDEGSGIPPNVLKRIGEPFFTTKETGTGLGMTISYQIIEAHKGRIDITSDEKGTCIQVTLPAVLSHK
nr:ATP-binding protein [Neobacillus sp. Marseille-Q6967]